jgi:hypothetical protein
VHDGDGREHQAEHHHRHRVGAAQEGDEPRERDEQAGERDERQEHLDGEDLEDLGAVLAQLAPPKLRTGEKRDQRDRERAHGREPLDRIVVDDAEHRRTEDEPRDEVPDDPWEPDDMRESSDRVGREDEEAEREEPLASVRTRAEREDELQADEQQDEDDELAHLRVLRPTVRKRHAGRAVGAGSARRNLGRR